MAAEEEPTRSVRLTDNELVLLDGNCSDGVQSEVDAAKRRIAECDGRENTALWRIIADAKTYAETHKKISLRWNNCRYVCPVCGTGGGYHKRKRASKYYRKGDPDFKKPVLTYWADLGESHVRDVVFLGMCRKCWEEHRETVALALDGLEAEIDAKITGHSPQWLRMDVFKCKCGWVGSEGEMGRLPCLMGSGTYAGKCPKCNAENMLFGRDAIKRTGECVLVENSEGVSK